MTNKTYSLEELKEMQKEGWSAGSGDYRYIGRAKDILDQLIEMKGRVQEAEDLFESIYRQIMSQAWVPDDIMKELVRYRGATGERLCKKTQERKVSSKGCGKSLAKGQWWSYCGETDMGQTSPALCTECGGSYKLAPPTPKESE